MTASLNNIFESLKQILLYDSASPLLFNTGLFLILFTLFLGIYEIIKRRATLKMLVTIAFSLYFYYKSSAEYCWILIGICLSDYILGNLMSILKRDISRRSIVAINVIINIGILVYFKYFNLILSTFAEITQRDFDALDIVLPAGISFFTFRSISYIIDLYRNEITPERNLLHYTFSLTFFPPLLAGPVVRAKDFLPQVKANPIATREMVGEGLFLIMVGLIKKIIIADYISGNFVSRVFDNPALYTGFENLMAWFGFSLQLYCDFSGYSDMAIGIALLLGYRFKDNFNAPFKAQNPSEFWRRWHISLSTWLRDYLYIPLGGNRMGEIRTYINNFLTMVIGGLWHGANWMYLLWGAYHGLLLAAHKALKLVCRIPEQLKENFAFKIFSTILTFALIVFGFAIFRATSLENLSIMITQIIDNFHISIAAQFFESYSLIVLAIVAGFLAHFAPSGWSNAIKEKYTAMPAIYQSSILAIVLFFVIQARSSDLVPFIYLSY